MLYEDALVSPDPKTVSIDLYRKTEKRSLRLALVNSLNQKIAENLELDKVLESIARAAVDLTGGEKSRIFVLNDREGKYDLRSTYGKIFSGGHMSFRPGQGLTGAVAQSGEGLIVPDIQAEPRWINRDWAKKMISNPTSCIPSMSAEKPSS
jgi:Nif-specific regulatory protein